MNNATGDMVQTYSNYFPDISIIYQDAHFIALNKPAGLLCVPGRGEDKQDALSTRVQRYFENAKIVHRLDMATSGIVIMALGQKMQAALSRLFEQRQVFKLYTAIICAEPSAANLPQNAPMTLPGSALWPEAVCGVLPAALRHLPAQDWCVIDAPMRCDWERRPLQIIDHTEGKSAQTYYCEGDAGTTTPPLPPSCATQRRLWLMPRTGRTHQLRLHMQHMGWPIVGDALYAPPSVAQASPRLLLHASWTAFVHPAHGQWVSIYCPADF